MLNFLPVLSWKFHPFCSWLNWAHIMFCASQKEFLSSCRWRLQSGWSWCKFQDVLPAPWGLSVNMRSTVTNVQVREKLGKNSNLCLSLKVLWSQPQFSSLRGGCHCLREPPSVSLRSQGHHCKYPVNTATSPLRSAHSLHLRTRHTHKGFENSPCGFFSFPVFADTSGTYPVWVVIVLLSWHRFCCCQSDQAALRKNNFNNCNLELKPFYITSVFVYSRAHLPLSLPFTKLSHSLNHCMLMHRITVGASSAWNSLLSYTGHRNVI